MVKKSKVLGKRTVSEIEEDDTINVIQALKENINFLKNENVKYRTENKELKNQIERYSKGIKCCKTFIYGTIFINVVALIGAVYMEYNKS